MTYKKFEDIKVWQDARILVNNLYKLIKSNSSLAKDYSLCDQLKRASYSVMLNVAEGFERRSNKEFANFLNIAKGSAGEVRSIIHIVQDLYSVNVEQILELIKEVEAISAQLHGLRNYLLKAK
ncbi:MAG: four helix bundle protein [Patescibacteria group bacterium]